MSNFSYFNALHLPWRSYADKYLCSLEFSASTIDTIRQRIARFLYAIQTNGITSPSQISFSTVEMYCTTLQEQGENQTNRYIYAASDILLHLANMGLCAHSLGWFPYFFPHGSIVYMKDLATTQIDRIMAVKAESKDFPSEDFASLIPEYLKQLEELGYSKTEIKSAHTTLYSFLVFLGMNDLGFHSEIANVWLECKQSQFDSSHWRRYRRTLFSFDLFTKENAILPRAIYKSRTQRIEQLPSWCRDQIDPFLKMKAREGLDEKTVLTYRSAVTRFCIFLVNNGIAQFSDLTPDLIKKYNQQDNHSTPEGKNTYNCRVKKFIRFLERQGILPYGLSESLFNKSASRERIVVTLTDDELCILKQKLDNASSPMELRDRAIITIGLKMGLRPCDIVSIKLTDIDWKKQSIHIMQEKTNREIILPMPTEVGNAIYLYLKNGRPTSPCDTLFIRHRAPCDSIRPSACDNLLRKYLPDRKIPRSNFCVTRKTFSTEQLRSGRKMQIVAELNGHRNIDSLKRYINLDAENMRLCGLSLSESSLNMREGYYGNISKL